MVAFPDRRVRRRRTVRLVERIDFRALLVAVVEIRCRLGDVWSWLCSVAAPAPLAVFWTFDPQQRRCGNLSALGANPGAICFLAAQPRPDTARIQHRSAST